MKLNSSILQKSVLSEYEKQYYYGTEKLFPRKFDLLPCEHIKTLLLLLLKCKKMIVGLKSLKSHISEWLIQLFDLLQVTSLTRRFLSYFSMKEWHWHVNFKIFIFHYDNFYIYKKYCKQNCIWQLQTNCFLFCMIFKLSHL